MKVCAPPTAHGRAGGSVGGDGGVWHSTLAIPLKLKRMTSQTLQGAPPGCDSSRMLPLLSCIPSRIVLHSSTRNSPMPGTRRARRVCRAATGEERAAEWSGARARTPRVPSFTVRVTRCLSVTPVSFTTHQHANGHTKYKVSSHVGSQTTVNNFQPISLQPKFSQPNSVHEELWHTSS